MTAETGMRIVVVGASGNIGTALIRSLAGDPRIGSLVGVARRTPSAKDGVEWHAADVAESDLEHLFRGAQAVVSLAWRIQPSRQPDALRQTNVVGSERVFEAARRAGVETLVYGSSVAAYAPGPSDRRADETWPVGGVRTSFYARHKTEVERCLDRFEANHPEIRVVRMRPALVFQRASATQQRRLFLGPFLPSPLLRPGRLPIVPYVRGLRFQAVHATDVADAYRRALTSEVRGAFNLAAEPVLSQNTVASLLRTRAVAVPPMAARAALALTWRARLQPSPPGWLDMGLAAPILDTSRARSELGWTPAHDSLATLREALEGIAEGAGGETPPLDPAAGGPLRVEELTTGVGGREAL